MKCKFHRPTSITHLIFFFFFNKKLKNIKNKPRMQCMNVMQMQILKKKQVWSQEIERNNTRTMLDKLTKAESFASKLF